MSDFLPFLTFILLLGAQLSAVIAAHQVRVTKTPTEYDAAPAQLAPEDDGQVQNTWISG